MAYSAVAFKLSFIVASFFHKSLFSSAEPTAAWSGEVVIN